MVARTLTASQIDALSIPTRSEIQAAAAALPQLEQGTWYDQGQGDWRRWDARQGLFLEVASGMLRVFRTSAHLKDAAVDRAEAEKARVARQVRAAYRTPMAFLTAGEIELLGGPKLPHTTTARRITAWTRRSRSRMQQQLNRLDFTPLFQDGLEPAMVTLTMPGLDEHGQDVWGDLAATPAAFKKIVDRFTWRYQQSWNSRLRAVWKLEFQERGAPHLHVLMTPPAGTTKTKVHGDIEFPQWLALTWAACVGAEGVARVNHEAFTLRAETISYVGDAYRDPRRIAAYFGKHGFFAAKGYQNELPELWADAIKDGATGARYWGVWGLDKASAVVQLDEVGSATVETLLDPTGVIRGAASVVSRIIGYCDCWFESTVSSPKRFHTDSSSWSPETPITSSVINLRALAACTASYPPRPALRAMSAAPRTRLSSTSTIVMSDQSSSSTCIASRRVFSEMRDRRAADASAAATST